MPKVYPLETVERGLQLLAVLGSSTLTARKMKEEGIEVPRRTLEDWRDKWHTERYAAICADVAPKIRERLAAETEQIADKLARLEHQIADRLADQLDDLDPKDLSNALRNVGTDKGINLDHSSKLRNQPTVVVEHKHSVDQLDQALRALGVIESTAVEVDTPQLEAATGD